MDKGDFKKAILQFIGLRSTGQDLNDIFSRFGKLQFRALKDFLDNMAEEGLLTRESRRVIGSRLAVFYGLTKKGRGLLE